MDPQPVTRGLPSDIAQSLIVARYELLKYLRSRRFLIGLVIVTLGIAPTYILPPALGSPYTGTAANEPLPLWTFPPGLVLANLSHRGVDAPSLVLALNGTPLPSAGAWQFNATFNAVVFYPGLLQGNLSQYAVTASYDWATDPVEFAGSFLQFLQFLLVITVTFFAADAIVSEFSNRTGFLLFPNPARRSALLGGKFLASLGLTLLLVGLYYALIAGLSWATLGGVASRLGLSFVFALWWSAGAVAVAFLLSSVLRGVTEASVLTFFLFLMILPIIDVVGEAVGIEFWWSLTFTLPVATNILEVPYPGDQVIDAGPGFQLTLFSPDPGVSSLVVGLYLAGALLVAYLLFRRRQMLG